MARPPPRPESSGCWRAKVAAKGIDGGDAELGGQIEELPSEGVGAVEGAAGERAWVGVTKLVENAIAHLGGGGVGEGDGDDLAGIVDRGQQGEKALGQKGGFAGAGGGLDEDGARGLGLVRAGFGRAAGNWERDYSSAPSARLALPASSDSPSTAIRFSWMRHRVWRPQRSQVLG
jgi:hypothetical protein